MFFDVTFSILLDFSYLINFITELFLYEKHRCKFFFVSNRLEKVNILMKYIISPFHLNGIHISGPSWIKWEDLDFRAILK